MASEIGGLANLRGYLKVLNLVVRLDLARVEPPAMHPAFVPRALPFSPLIPHGGAMAAAAATAPEDAYGQVQTAVATASPKHEPFFQ
jgi:hypothetical protein